MIPSICFWSSHSNNQISFFLIRFLFLGDRVWWVCKVTIGGYEGYYLTWWVWMRSQNWTSDSSVEGWETKKNIPFFRVLWRNILLRLRNGVLGIRVLGLDENNSKSWKRSMRFGRGLRWRNEEEEWFTRVLKVDIKGEGIVNIPVRNTWL